MGLDAFVYCRCWQDGVATPPPIGPVGFDDEGYLGLTLPWDGNEAAHTAIEIWLTRACPHDRMKQAHEHVSNWAGLRLFQQVLDDVGWSHFPALHSGLPRANGGSLPAEQASIVLAELDYFRGVGQLADEVVLADEATGRVLMTYVAAYDGVMMLGPGYRAGVDPEGFFVLDPGVDPPATLFRAQRFSQQAFPGNVVRFVSDELTARVSMPPVGQHDGGQSQWLAVRSRPRTAEDFDYIVQPLRRLCEASVLTGNPVMWT
jgi:hypothetical protein